MITKNEIKFLLRVLGIVAGFGLMIPEIQKFITNNIQMNPFYVGLIIIIIVAYSFKLD